MPRPKLAHSKAGRQIEPRAERAPQQIDLHPPRPGADLGSMIFDFMTRGARAQAAVDRILEEHRAHNPDEVAT
jgi:hypothetical protein